MNKKCDIALKYIVYLLIFEIVLGGAGREITIGHMTIRMILYVVAFIIVAICFFNNGFKSYNENFKKMGLYYIVAGMFMAWVAFSAINGYFFAHRSLSEVIGDVTGYMSFLILLVFNLAINGKKQIKDMYIAFVIAAVIQSIIIIIIHIGLGLNIFEFTSMNDLLQKLYIGNLSYIVPNTIRIFFKSSIYLQVVFVVLIGMSSREEFKKYKKLIYLGIVFVTYANILSFTRGFWIGAVVSIFLFVLLKQVKNLKKIILVIVLGTVVMLGISYISYGNNGMMLSVVSRSGLVHQSTAVTIKGTKTIVKPGLSGDDVSLDYRKKLSKYMLYTINQHPILGNGFGVILKQIGQTTSRCEYMYLDIWMEMGIVGLAIFATIYLAMFVEWIKIRKNNSNGKDLYMLDATMVSLVGLIITTGLNPFFNNPLGITYTIFSICVVNVYRKEK